MKKIIKQTKLMVCAALIAGFAITPVFYRYGRSGSSGVAVAAPSSKRPKMVTKNIERQIQRGLKYLAKAQRADGSWSNTGGTTYTMAMTSLAGLALLSSGSTAESGPYRKNVKKALEFVIQVGEKYQAVNKKDKRILLAQANAASRPMYGHGYSMLFLAQCYGMENNKARAKRIKVVLDGAVALTRDAQSKIPAIKAGGGGWTYTPDANTDEGSVTVTQLQALRACRNVGIKVPGKTIDGAVRYLKACQNADGGICYMFSSRGQRSQPALSAAAIACFYAAGIYDPKKAGFDEENVDPKSDAMVVKKLLEYVDKNITVQNARTSFYLYTQFYNTQAQYMRGGKTWKTFYPQISRKFLSLQNSNGYWDHSSYGSVFATAIAVMILDMPYGYLPIWQR